MNCVMKSDSRHIGLSVINVRHGFAKSATKLLRMKGDGII